MSDCRQYTAPLLTDGAVSTLLVLLAIAAPPSCRDGECEPSKLEALRGTGPIFMLPAVVFALSAVVGAQRSDACRQGSGSTK